MDEVTQAIQDADTPASLNGLSYAQIANVLGLGTRGRAQQLVVKGRTSMDR